MSADKDLPAEVWSQILARLPVKSVLRLRSVNKTVCSVIDDPYFMSVHYKQYNNNGTDYDKTQLMSLHIMRDNTVFKACKISLRSYDTLTETFEIFHARVEAYAFLGSCLGLMLIKRYYPRQLLRLWNPSIRKSIVVPPCPFADTLTFDVAYALGFSLSTHCFKVAAFQVNRTQRGWRPIESVAVYTVGDDQSLWRIITDDSGIADIPIREAKCRGPLLYFKGGVHWLTNNYNIGEKYCDNTHLMSFDFDSEKFSCVELPDAKDKKYGLRIEFLLGEAVAYMSITKAKRQIWVMNKNDDTGHVSWNLWFSSPNTENKLWKFRRKWSRELFYVDNGCTSFTFGTHSYDIATSKFSKLVKSSDEDTFMLDTYLESLALYKQGKTFPS